MSYSQMAQLELLNALNSIVAPSVLHIMGLQQPKEMTGQCLISE